MTYSEQIRKQRDFFTSGTTKNLTFRRNQLIALKQTIQTHKQDIIQALKTDLSKPEFESYIAEIHFVLSEINIAIKHLFQWTQPQKVKTPLRLFPASSSILPEPRGIVLIIAPWNYPFQLIFAPLVGAIAAGNCAVVKPSEYAPASAQLIASLIANTFTPEFISVVEGDASAAQALLKERFDYIFFTGSTRVGKLVMQAAAQHLTPLTLELGGKNPCIVTASANIDCAARRIVWGKFFNAGQNCVSPDYLLVASEIKEKMVLALKKCITKFYGTDPQKSNDYARIINAQHMDRLATLLKDGNVIDGGTFNKNNRYFAPTLLDDTQPTSPLMTEEIFGPLLPIVSYSTLSEAIAYIEKRPHPLALYIFSSKKSEQKMIVDNTQSGGVCINDTLIQAANPHLPFGGIGTSGFGSYHGKSSFDTFSHFKAVMNSSCIDFKLRYAPYNKKHQFIQKLLDY